jgi:TolA-binding protein
VQSGEVRLRLHGQPDLRLRAGEHWSRTSAPAAETTAKPGMPASSAVGNPEGAVPGDKSQGVASMRALRRSVPTRAPGVPQPSDGIAAEDAAYVAILSLLRHGDPSDALLSARDYLRRYPDGLRRPEVAQIAARLAGRPGLAPND